MVIAIEPITIGKTGSWVEKGTSGEVNLAYDIHGSGGLSDTLSYFKWLLLKYYKFHLDYIIIVEAAGTKILIKKDNISSCFFFG